MAVSKTVKILQRFVCSKPARAVPQGKEGVNSRSVKVVLQLHNVADILECSTLLDVQLGDSALVFVPRLGHHFGCELDCFDAFLMGVG